MHRFVFLSEFGNQVHTCENLAIKYTLMKTWQSSTHYVNLAIKYTLV